MRPGRLRRACAQVLGHALVALCVGALTAAAPVAAAWLQSATATSSFATDSLQPATNLTATRSCVLTVRTITLDWTASSSTYATGYKILRKTGSGSFVEHATVVGRLTTVFVDTPLAQATTYTYYVQTVYQSWTAATGQQSATTHGAVCV